MSRDSLSSVPAEVAVLAHNNDLSGVGRISVEALLNKYMIRGTSSFPKSCIYDEVNIHFCRRNSEEDSENFCRNVLPVKKSLNRLSNKMDRGEDNSIFDNEFRNSISENNIIDSTIRSSMIQRFEKYDSNNNLFCGCITDDHDNYVELDDECIINEATFLFNNTPRDTIVSIDLSDSDDIYNNINCSRRSNNSNHSVVFSAKHHAMIDFCTTSSIFLSWQSPHLEAMIGNLAINSSDDSEDDDDDDSCFAGRKSSLIFSGYGTSSGILLFQLRNTFFLIYYEYNYENIN